MTRRARLIVNPIARTLPGRDRLATAPAWLRLHGWAVDTHWTEGPGHATALARAAADAGYDAVIAAGGDGTVNEVVNGLAGTPTALAVIAGGTANIWMRETGTPRHPGSVAALLERGARRRIDLGQADGRYFLLMASCGLDSTVAAAMRGPLKTRFGRMAYVALGLHHTLRYRGVTARIEADGWRWEGPLYLALLGNTRSYGGLIRLSHQARADDGLLDLVIYRAGGLPRFTADLSRTLAGRHVGARGAVYRQVRAATVTTEPSVPVQVDGEVIGMTPMTFRVVPAALTVIVPADCRAPIFGGPP